MRLMDAGPTPAASTDGLATVAALFVALVCFVIFITIWKWGSYDYGPTDWNADDVSEEGEEEGKQE